MSCRWWRRRRARRQLRRLLAGLPAELRALAIAAMRVGARRV